MADNEEQNDQPAEQSEPEKKEEQIIPGPEQGVAAVAPVVLDDKNVGFQVVPKSIKKE